MFYPHININESQPGKPLVPKEVFGSPGVFLVMVDWMFMAMAKKNENLKVCYFRIEKNGKRWVWGYSCYKVNIKLGNLTLRTVDDSMKVL